MRDSDPRLSSSRKPNKGKRATPSKLKRSVKAASKRAAATSSIEDLRAAPDGSFPIVGIGASAGGLEALEVFLKHVPPGSGMGFVIVQHLDPTHKGMLVELLQRSTAMPVAQAQDQQKVEVDHVYVIPPNKDMSILHGSLHLLPQAHPRGLNLPIDFFFRSLAADQHERAIGVILSGMGSDGTLGLRAIKEKAGAAFVQDLSSAKFDGMPRSVIDAGLADVVAEVADLPAKIIAYRKHAPHIDRPEVVIESKADAAVEKVFILLRAQTGNDFSQYKRSTTIRRIERRMGLHQVDSVAHYVRLLRENPRELELLSQELLIGVTSFFRDPAAWEHLRDVVMPALLASRPSGTTLRAWVPGCSTGEEAFSLAMIFKEASEPFRAVRAMSLQIFATDLDREAIERARLGLYPDNIAADVSPVRLRRFFVRDERGYRVAKEIREMVVFAPQNIIMDPPFTKLDILSCRNLLIYLGNELQKRLIPLFHYSLTPGGILFLGNAETVGSGGLFAALDGKTRLFRRIEQPVAAVPVNFPVSPPLRARGDLEQAEPEAPAPALRAAQPNLQALADRVLVQRLAPVAVLCTEQGDVLYVSSRAGKYLEPTVGKANLNVFGMAREGLRQPLSRAFSEAVREDRVVTAKAVKVADNGGTHTVDFTIQKLAEPRELRGSVMITFSDGPTGAPVPKAPKRGPVNRPPLPRVSELEEDLRRAQADLQTTREEMQTSQEELKSSNEELQSTNEELQSTNEELTTSKEEMQSLNEELQTVNGELQAKVDELSRANNDMKNLLNSTDIATLFLDGDLHIRRFTTPTSKIIKLLPGDVGRPVTDLVSNLEYPELADDARDVLRTLVFKEKVVGTSDGRWFTVRILPYRTVDNVIEGVVITFTDSSASRTLESALREQASNLRQMTESLPNMVWGCQPEGACDYLSRQWVDYTGVSARDQLGYGWLEQVHADDRERVRQAWREAVKAGKPFDGEFRIRNGQGAYRWFKSRSVPIRDAAGLIVKWYGTNTDVDDLKHAQLDRRLSGDRLEAVLDGIREGFVAMDEGLVVSFFNREAARLLEREPGAVVGRRFLEVFPALRGSELEQRIHQVLRDKRPALFETSFEAVPRPGRYRVSLIPQIEPAGVAAFFEPAEKGAAP